MGVSEPCRSKVRWGTSERAGAESLARSPRHGDVQEYATACHGDAERDGAPCQRGSSATGAAPPENQRGGGEEGGRG